VSAPLGRKFIEDRAETLLRREDSHQPKNKRWKLYNKCAQRICKLRSQLLPDTVLLTP
jgi:hypothetical protein